jgi:6-phosphofructokinase 1
MSDVSAPTKLAVLTSGGDSAGMNAAVRAVVRSGLAAGLTVFGVYEGFQGLVEGGGHLRPMTSAAVGGILQLGGTVLGTARSAEFRTRDGRRRAARHLVEREIDGLVVIGGDGSLSGANEFRTEWPDLLDELVAEGAIDRKVADGHRRLALVGLVGSIDNDMYGTDMTIGADTALHRITEAVDAIQSTASSHQRTFVIEVMGRNCGYLALMGGLATGTNFVLIPESPAGEDWEAEMCRVLRAGREIGRRANMVLVAEGARDLDGDPVTATRVKSVLEEQLGEDARVTILGHVQRGGAPSAFDRYLGTVLGHAAVQQLLRTPEGEPQVLGIRGHRLTRAPLMESVASTRSIASVIAQRDSETAMRMRGGNFSDSYRLLRTLEQARPHRPERDRRSPRIAILHAGAPAPGMNAAVRVAARVAMDHGTTVLSVRDGFAGLLAGAVDELSWMAVSGWVARPGAELGTSLFVPEPKDAAAIAAHLAAHDVDGVLMIGGWAGYVAASLLMTWAVEHPELAVPVVCVPASIDNNLPQSDMSIGADSALNSIMSDVDKIKESAVSAHQCFVVEVMGHDAGFLALMSAVATGAERAYLPEEGISLRRLQDDLDALRTGFALGKRRGLVLRSERADEVFTTDFVASLLRHESAGLFDVRTTILGDLQQGGSPSPFDRIQATRLASAAVEHLIGQLGGREPASAMVGLREGKVAFTPLADFQTLVEPGAERARGPAWWMALRPLVDLMAKG